METTSVVLSYQRLKRGQNIHIYHFNDEAKLMAFHRWDKQGPTDSVVVVVNMTNQGRDGYVIGLDRKSTR